MGFATAVGGLLGHAFLYYFSFAWKLPGWFTSMVSIAVLERACILQARRFIRPGVARFFIWLNIIELLTFMFISFSTLNFIYVEVHTAYGLGVVVFSLSIYLYRQTGNPGNKLFIVAVVVSSFAGIFFIGKIGLGIWFNHYDISHCFMTISAWIFYLGSKKIITNLGPGKLYD